MSLSVCNNQAKDQGRLRNLSVSQNFGGCCSGYKRSLVYITYQNSESSPESWVLTQCQLSRVKISTKNIINVYRDSLSWVIYMSQSNQSLRSSTPFTGIGNGFACSPRGRRSYPWGYKWTLSSSRSKKRGWLLSSTAAHPRWCHLLLLLLLLRFLFLLLLLVYLFLPRSCYLLCL